MVEDNEMQDAYERAWTIRFLDSARFVELVDALEPGPITTYLRSRIAQSQGRLDETLTLCQQALDAMEPESVWAARLLETRGNVLSALGLRDEAQASLAEAWRIYELVGDDVGRASVRQNTAVLGFQPHATVLSLLHEALGIAEGAGREDLVGLITLNLANEMAEQGPLDDAGRAERRRLVGRAGELLERSWPQMALRVRASEVDLALEDDDVPRAARLALRLPDPMTVPDPTIRTHLVLTRGELALALDEQVEEAARLVTGVVGDVSAPEDLPLLHHMRARLLERAGIPEQALAAEYQAYETLREQFHADRMQAGRALDVWHRTAQLREERAAQAQRADALETALRELQIATERVHELSIRDAVTGLHNRQWLMDHAPAALDDAEAMRPAQVALIDLDHFKEINDRHGHDIGDSVLCRFADALTAALPASDLVARYGGEEFVVVRPADGRGLLAADLDTLRCELARGPWTSPEGETLPAATMTAGVSRAVAGGLRDALRAADRLMYEAKRSGRDRVLDAGGPGVTGEADKEAVARPDAEGRAEATTLS